ncbi:DUF2383 domain-containing protein [Legionella saoudiensis]|uniref:DUF2383 domain-containing protein n=1 Tax=Legionella saoudiensis TaxID=1750561 RepID=UPI00073188D0|nr:DUF2383 domain-containing protein [Legionella saoudiensis]
MTTLVGTQKEFHDALYELCELDYDAIEAYKAAINRLENNAYKNVLTEFLYDHERHVQELTNILRSRQHPFPDGPGMKEYLAQGKVVLANLMGDRAILKAMVSNEVDTNTAYERVNNYSDIWPDALAILQRGLEDERRHKQWLESTLEKTQ